MSERIICNENGGELREEIIRCRDCRFYVRDPDPVDPGWPMMCEWTEMDMINPNGFCAWGERKGER